MNTLDDDKLKAHVELRVADIEWKEFESKIRKHNKTLELYNGISYEDHGLYSNNQMHIVTCSSKDLMPILKLGCPISECVKFDRKDGHGYMTLLINNKNTTPENEKHLYIRVNRSDMTTHPTSKVTQKMIDRIKKMDINMSKIVYNHEWYKK